MKHLKLLPRKTVEDFVRYRTIAPDDEEFLHEACYQIYNKRKPSTRRLVLGKVNGDWKQLLVNNWLKFQICKKCNVKLQCSCSPFKATDPGETKCTHGED